MQTHDPFWHQVGTALLDHSADTAGVSAPVLGMLQAAVLLACCQSDGSRVLTDQFWYLNFRQCIESLPQVWHELADNSDVPEILSNTLNVRFSNILYTLSFTFYILIYNAVY